ncbi:hypothetical protein BC834DRAFT_822169 [Gloeopeniophorella convolvens]|nr:hypothetical protein BC834DRAFT_822169 [Gloeopeniophorella convolvens]
MKIAVTGCSGGVGQRIVLLALREGHTVHGIDQRRGIGCGFGLDEHFTFAEVDLRDFDATLAALRGCDAAVHMAAHPGPGDYLVAAHNDNVVMSYNVLRACAELGIKRVAQASSVNVLNLCFSNAFPRVSYFPLDEEHPCEPDEPYGLSKLIAEAQADALVRRFPSLRIASLRFTWSLPSRARAAARPPAGGARDLWGWVHEDAVARGALLALTSTDWTGHERFFLAAPDIAPTGPGADAAALHAEWFDGVPVRDGRDLKGRAGFIDCSKAARMLGWVHWEDGGE